MVVVEAKRSLLPRRFFVRCFSSEWHLCDIQELNRSISVGSTTFYRFGAVYRTSEPPRLCLRLRLVNVIFQTSLFSYRTPSAC